MGLWSFVDPVGDAQADVSSNVLRIDVPAGVNHDIWTDGNRAPRVMQAIADADFEIEAKFESAPVERYQMQGLIVEQDAANFLRFEVHSDGAGVRLFAASFIDGQPSIEAYQAINSGAAYFLRVKRQAAQWTFSYSLDGQSWAVGAVFNRALAVGSCGVFAGNAGGGPAFTAMVDYFFNTASPIVPEDGYTVTTSVRGSGTVTRNPDLATYPAGQIVELTAVPAAGWGFAGWSGSIRGRINPVQLTVSRNIDAVATFTNMPLPAATLTSDDFSAGTLDTNLWTFVNPRGDAQASVGSAALRIEVPSGASHDVWTDGSFAPRVMQTVADADFEMEVKFDSIPQQQYQMQGVLVEQDAGNFLRFDFYSDGATVRLFAASFDAGVPSVQFIQPVSTAAAYFVRVKREAAQWTLSYSLDGQAWTVGAVFNRTLAVKQVGVFAGNAGGNPPFTAVVDYVFNTASPIVPEDGIALTVNVVGVGTVVRDPNLASYSAGQTVELTAVPDMNWAFAGWSGAVTGSANPISLTLTQDSAVTATFTNVPPPPATLGAPASDDFSGGALNTNLWTFVNPVGDAQVGVSGNALRIEVPAGVSHDVWTDGNFTPRLMQAVADTDFELEAKFQSAPQDRCELQGFIVEQDAGNFLRLEVHTAGAGPRLFAANFVDGSPGVIVNEAVPSSPAYFLRVKRQGSQWTYSYSLDGQSWVVGASFSRVLAVARAGVFAGNAADNPAFTAVVDYVFNTASPIVPEDGGLLTVTANVAGQGVVDRNPNRPTYTAGQTVALTALPASNWTFVAWSGAAQGSANPLTVTLDRDVEIAAKFMPTNAAAIIEVWHGDYQVFGQHGLPQKWANLLGRVLVPSEVTALSYELNGQFQSYLSFRAGSNYRLARDGDFNVELEYATLPPGTNLVNITALLRDGSQFTRTVLVIYDAGHQWPAPCSIDWNSVTEINDVAQVVDGDWTVTSGGVRTVNSHYDRLIALGDMGWTDYEVTVPVTVHAATATFPGYVPSVGLLLRWQGHYDWNGEQPRIGWNPLGAIGWITWSDSAATSAPFLEMFENNGSRRSTAPKSFALGSRYLFKMRVETVPQPSEYKAVYSLKVWPDGQPEPAAWDIIHPAVAGLDNGSLVLVSHFADTTFGNINVVPITPP